MGGGLKYLKGPSGALRIVQLLLAFIIIVCSSACIGNWGAFSSVLWALIQACVAVVVFSALLIGHLTQQEGSSSSVGLAAAEIIANTIWTVFYFSVGVCAAIISYYYYSRTYFTDSTIALSFFGFLSSIVHAADAIRNCVIWKNAVFGVPRPEN